MDLNLTAATVTAAYLPVQGVAPQSGVRSSSTGNEAQSIAAASGERPTAPQSRLDTASTSPEALKAQEEAALRKDPTADLTSTPGFSFEYEDNHQVMKVHNAKGILIYQVPSKGQLALIQAEESAQQSGQKLRLTA